MESRYSRNDYQQSNYYESPNFKQSSYSNSYMNNSAHEKLRVSNPASQDYYLGIGQQDKSQNLKQQLNQEIRRNQILQQQANQIRNQNQILKRNTFGTGHTQQQSHLRNENARLREEIERKRLQMNVPQHLIDQLSELRRQNSDLRRNVSYLSQKGSQQYRY